jgi:mono/diheme cytochrome c family protein
MAATPDSWTPVPGREFVGRHWAPDGVPFVSAPNLTSDPETGIGSFSDDALARAIREGIGNDGRTLFPIMPYPKFRSMTDEDLASIVVYLRSLPPVKNRPPKSEVPFPLNRLINSMPQPINAPVTADLSTPEKRGEYIVTMAACADCHTPTDDQGAELPGMSFAGGFKLTFTGIPAVTSQNITPGVNGIPYYTESLFVEVFRTGRVRERKLSPLKPTQFYGKMREEDLKAIFAYLKSLPPVDHFVDNAMPPTKCARCNGEHGGGERNKKI